uniref:Uncharacterized protein AlNc14C3G419 n=1 Tax=Albugo laibachii Nc14 TaxID=890382 RepID=F0VZU0_9STRA|nr:conserved hypothetical protein [Albugo laibachii Nc14]|eukprot:CCA14311.1 conserved hypothetical protein [Albugo laibachii Nc14]
MFDILSSPIRSYIAQTLQFYLSKYIEGIHLEGLGLFGGDLVLNDLEIKRHVLLESLEISPSFDFSRGFIRELRIHIPWTQLLSQPIEVKLYTIEIILTTVDSKKGGQRPTSPSTKRNRSPSGQDTQFDESKPSWIHESLQKILVNVTVQVNNLVVKYEESEIVFSMALGSLEIKSAKNRLGWTAGFAEAEGPQQKICKLINATDLTIFLDRYTKNKEVDTPRRVIGYEIPMLNRGSISSRVRLCLKQLSDIDEDEVHVASFMNTDTTSDDACQYMKGLHRPCPTQDPLSLYLKRRSGIQPLIEVDINIGNLQFSISDRQLKMLVEVSQSSHMLRTKSSLKHQHESSGAYEEESCKNLEASSDDDRLNEKATMDKASSWLDRSLDYLRFTNDVDDPLISELLAESERALTKTEEQRKSIKSTPSATCTCVRVSIESCAITLRQHKDEAEGLIGAEEEKDDTELLEELIPVANLGLVPVRLHQVRTTTTHPPVSICTLFLTSTALEAVFDSEKQSRTTASELQTGIFDLALQIECIRVYCDSLEVDVLTWGSASKSTHPFMQMSFFNQEHLSEAKADSEQPRSSNPRIDMSCNCDVFWEKRSQECVSLSTLMKWSAHIVDLISKTKVSDPVELQLLLEDTSTEEFQGFACSNLIADNPLWVDVISQILRASCESDQSHLGFEAHAFLFKSLTECTLHACGKGAEYLREALSKSKAPRTKGAAVCGRFCLQTVQGDDIEAEDAQSTLQIFDVSLGPMNASIDYHFYRDLREVVSLCALKGEEKVVASKSHSNASAFRAVTWSRVDVACTFPTATGDHNIHFGVKNVVYEQKPSGEISFAVDETLFEIGEAFSAAMNSSVVIYGLKSHQGLITAGISIDRIVVKLREGASRDIAAVFGQPMTSETNSDAAYQFQVTNASVDAKKKKNIEITLYLGSIHICRTSAKGRAYGRVLQAGFVPAETIKERWMIHVQIECERHQKLDQLFIESPGSHKEVEEALVIVKLCAHISKVNGNLSSVVRTVQCIQRVAQVASSASDKMSMIKQNPTEGLKSRVRFSLGSNTRVEFVFTGGSLELNRGIGLLLPLIRVESIQSADSKRAIRTLLDLTWKLSLTTLYCKVPNSSGDQLFWTDILQLEGMEGSASYIADAKNTDGKEVPRKVLIIMRFGTVDLKLSRYNMYWLCRLPFVCKALSPIPAAPASPLSHEPYRLPAMDFTFKLAIDCLKVSCHGGFQQFLSGNSLSTTHRYGCLQMESKTIEFAADMRKQFQGGPDSLTMLDSQFYVMDINITEVVRLPRHVGNRFGDFGALPESTFPAFLLYLDIVELQAMETAVLGETNHSEMETNLSSPLFSWIITSSIIRAFRSQARSVKARDVSADTMDIPLLDRCKRDAYASIPSAMTSVASFSLIFSNYIMELDDNSKQEVPVCRFVFAASMESFNLALSTSSILLVASALSAPPCSCQRCDHAAKQCTDAQDPPIQKYALANIAEMELSVAIGSQRLALLDSTTPDENVFGIEPIVMSFDFISSSSSSWKNIWLERFRYSPFNAQALPSHQELITFSGHQNGDKRQISFRLSKLELSIIEWQPDSEVDKSLSLEDILGVFIQSRHVVLGPCNVTCEITVEQKVQKWAILLTKIRFQVEKQHFDKVIMHINTMAAAVGCARQSFVVVGTKKRFSKATCDTKQVAMTLELAIDGVTINMGQIIRSRLGHIGLSYSNVARSGSFYIQNFVAGHYVPSENSVEQVEDLILGPLSDPALWHKDVNNYFGKMFSGQWSLSDLSQNRASSMRLVCVDVQSFQLHLSGSFLKTLTEFLAVPPPGPSVRLEAHKQKLTSTPFELCNEKTSWKIVILPSLLSFIGQRSPSDQWAVAPRIWLSFGQVFVTFSLNDTSSKYPSLQHKCSPLYRFLPHTWMNVIVNVKKICIRVADTTWIVQNCLVPQQPDTQTSSWPQFWAMIRSANTCTKYDLIEEFSARAVGQCVVLLEKHDRTQMYFLTSCTAFSAAVDTGSIRFRISEYTLRALSLLSAVSLQTEDRPSHKAQTRGKVEPLPIDHSTDDLNDLSRIIKPHDHASPGELVLKESLTVETGNVYSQCITSQTTYCRVRTHLASNPQHEVSQVLESANQDAWYMEDHANGWMSMHWSYFLPRIVEEIVAFPVPIPPTGLPSGWLTMDNDREADLLCQIRYWDYDLEVYVLLGHFYIPWGTQEEYTSEVGDEEFDFEEHEDDEIILTNQPRHVTIQDAPASDRWEVRWRSPLIEEKEQEKRLTISALVATSIKVKSRLAMDAFKTLSLQICPIEIVGSICHYNFGKYSHDILTARAPEMCLKLEQAASGLYTESRVTFHLTIAMENIAQLATISLLPACKVDLQVRYSAFGLVLFFQMEPAAIFLTQNAILMAAYLTRLFTASKQSRYDNAISSRNDTLPLPEMRIVLVNQVGQDVWYRQEGSSEKIKMDADTSTAYSWAQLDLPLCMQFSLDISEDHWSEPYRIKHCAVSGRKLQRNGFLWISHQLSEHQSTVTLHPTLTIENYLKIPILASAKDFECQIPADARQYAMTENLHDVSITSSDYPEIKIVVPLKGKANFPAPLDPYYPTRDKTIVDIGVLRHNSIEEDVYVGVILSRRIDHVATDDQHGMRHTWLELKLVPPFSITNELSHPILAALSTTPMENKEAPVRIPQGQNRVYSSITPRLPSHLSLKLTENSMPFTTVLPGSYKGKEETILSNGYRIHFSNGASRSMSAVSERALVVIRIQYNLVVRNDTFQTIGLQLISDNDHAERITLDANAKTSLRCALPDDRILIRVGQIEDLEEDYIWSTKIDLAIGAPARICRLGTLKAGCSFMSIFFVKLEQQSGAPLLSIRPSVLVFDETNLDLYFASVDQRDNIDEAKQNAPWCPKVSSIQTICEEPRSKPRGFFRSWLEFDTSCESIVETKLCCQFVIGMMQVDTISWSDVVSIDPTFMQGDDLDAESGVFPAPSNRVEHQRILIQIEEGKHRMITYTVSMTQESVHVLFFIDPAPPIIIRNEWTSPLAISLVEAGSQTQVIGESHLIDFDWVLLEKQSVSIATIGEYHAWISQSTPENGEFGSEILRGGQKVKYRIGCPRLGWSQVIWQVQGIQFIKFPTSKFRVVFLVSSAYHAGTCYISIVCIEDPMETPKPLSTAHSDLQKRPGLDIKLNFHFQKLLIHCLDEYQVLNGKETRSGYFSYQELLRVAFSDLMLLAVIGVAAPERLQGDQKAGLLPHVEAFTIVSLCMKDMQVDDLAPGSTYPVVIQFQCARKTESGLDHFEGSDPHKRLRNFLAQSSSRQMEVMHTSCFFARVIYVHTSHESHIPPYYHTMELKMDPVAVQVPEFLLIVISLMLFAMQFEDAITSSLYRFLQPILDAIPRQRDIEGKPGSWSGQCLSEIVVTKQAPMYIEFLSLSELRLSITARTRLPILDSLNGTVLAFSAFQAHQISQFPDQILKDLAASYVADTIMRTPMLLMSLNIFGNPAYVVALSSLNSTDWLRFPRGFVRLLSAGVKDFLHHPFHAARTEGYNPWSVTKGLLTGAASFIRHTSEATLLSFAGFTYSVSRTMDHISLPSNQLSRHDHKPSTELSSALRYGIGSIGTGVVGAATGVIATPFAIYKNRKAEGLETGMVDIMTGVGKGIVGVVARPVAGVASFLSYTSDGILYGSGIQRSPQKISEIAFGMGASTWHARCNQIQRYRLKILSEPHGDLVLAYANWTELTPDGVHWLSKHNLTHLKGPDPSLPVALLASRDRMYLVGRFPLEECIIKSFPLSDIQVLEEDLTQPNKLAIGFREQKSGVLKTLYSVCWIRLQLDNQKRQELCDRVRYWMSTAAI